MTPIEGDPAMTTPGEHEPISDRSELANLDELAGEVQAAASAVEALDAAVDDLKAWASWLPERWAGAGWSTRQLDAALADVSAAVTGLKASHEVLEQLQAVNAALAQARAVGEAADAAGARGDLSGFQAEGISPASAAAGPWVDPGGDRMAREQSVELAIEGAYRMVVLLAEEDGVELTQVSKGQLQDRLDHDRRKLGAPAYPGAEVDAALERLAQQPGFHVQADALRIAHEEPEEPLAEVSGELSPLSLSDNGWGADPGSRIHFHDDGPIGEAIKTMGPDARMDVDGEPLGDVLGLLATDVVRGVRSAQVGLDTLKTLQARLPAGSRARAAIARAVAAIDAPSSPPPAVPAGTPDYLARLVEQLHAVPLVRRDPARELEPVLAIAADVAAGRKKQGLRLVGELEALSGRRHESLGDVGKYEIDRAITTAAQALLDQVRPARKAGS